MLSESAIHDANLLILRSALRGVKLRSHEMILCRPSAPL